MQLIDKINRMKAQVRHNQEVIKKLKKREDKQDIQALIDEVQAERLRRSEQSDHDKKRSRMTAAAKYREGIDKRIEDCNLSVRTTNICKENGIDTLGDICKLHETDWPKFSNGGKKSLIELDDLLHDNGLDWAEWR